MKKINLTKCFISASLLFATALPLSSCNCANTSDQHKGQQVDNATWKRAINYLLSDGKNVTLSEYSSSNSVCNSTTTTYSFCENQIYWSDSSGNEQFETQNSDAPGFIFYGKGEKKLVSEFYPVSESKSSSFPFRTPLLKVLDKYDQFVFSKGIYSGTINNISYSLVFASKKLSKIEFKSNSKSFSCSFSKYGTTESRVDIASNLHFCATYATAQYDVPAHTISPNTTMYYVFKMDKGQYHKGSQNMQVVISPSTSNGKNNWCNCISENFHVYHGLDTLVAFDSGITLSGTYKNMLDFDSTALPENNDILILELPCQPSQDILCGVSLSHNMM